MSLSFTRLLPSISFVCALLLNNAFAVETKTFRDSLGQIVYLDAKGLPRCVENGNRRGFMWWNVNENRYNRDVFVVQPARVGWDCNDWVTVSGWGGTHIQAAVKVKRAEVYKSSVKTIQRINISKELSERLAQIQLGASEYRSEKTGAQWLKNNPLNDYNIQLNAELTKRFGIGFTGEIYKAFVETRPQNSKIKNELVKRIEKSINNPAEQKRELAARSGKVKLLVSLGLGWVRGKKMEGPYDVPRLEQDLKSIGLNYSVLENKPFGRVKSNSQMLAVQIQEELEKGNDIMLMGACKGTAEIMNALAMIPNLVDANGKQTNPKYGRVIGVLSLSGLMKGSFLAEWISGLNDKKFFNWLFRVLKDGPFPSMHDIGTIIGVAPDLSTTQMEQDYAAYSKRVPKDIVYFNALGVMPGNGLMSDSPVAELQNKVIVPILKNANANDGYIDYPSSAIPDSMAKRVYSVVFDASHMIVDGKLNATWNGKARSYEMRNEKTRRAVLSAMFVLFSDLSANK